MARYAYIRLDDRDQEPMRQADLLDSIGGFDRIYVDNIRNKAEEDLSDAGSDGTKLEKAITSLAEGDVLYVAFADRVCGNIPEFIRLVRRIRSAGANFCCLEISFDTRSASADHLLRMLETLSRIETEEMSRKKKSGIARARAEGRRVGRPPVNIPAGFRTICRKWSEGAITGSQAIRMSGMKSTSFYKKAAELGFRKSK